MGIARMTRITVAVLLGGFLVVPCLAADPEPASRSEVEELRREVSELKALVEQMRQERAAAPAPVAGQVPASAPAAAATAPAAAAPATAAAVEAAKPASGKAVGADTPRPGGDVMATASEKPESALHFWGYGELNYNHYIEDSSRTQADLRRFVIGLSYSFNDRLRFNSEVEWEHAVASADDQGETEIEQAYLEYAAGRNLTVKGGLFLMPFGFLNEHHEPPVFYGVERNEVETRIIPTTWREGGFGLSWATDNGITYEAGVTTGFDISKFDDPGSPLASVHQELQLAKARDLSVYGAVNYRGVPGLTFGGAIFTGNSTQGNAAFKADNTQPDFSGLDARVSLWDLHARWQPGRLDLQALYARGYIGDAEGIDNTLLAYNQTNGASRAFVPSGFYGWYAQAAYRVWDRNDMHLTPFVRYEYYNTQSSMPAGFLADPANANHVFTGGLNFYPHPQVVLKADYQRYTDRELSRWDLGLGYMF
jgi:hypothetical protein